MSFLSNFFNESAEEKMKSWRDELVNFLSKVLDEDQFMVDDDGDVVIVAGTAHVFVEFGIDDEGEGWVVIHSPLVRLPEDNLLPFYRRLLDLNNEPFLFGSLSTRNDVVVLTRTIPVKGLEEEAFKFIVERICFEADDLDDKFIDEFKAPRFSFED
jgi:hypothetical protein